MVTVCRFPSCWPHFDLLKLVKFDVFFRTHKTNDWQFGMLMYPDHLHNWPYSVYGPLSFLVLAPLPEHYLDPMIVTLYQGHNSTFMKYVATTLKIIIHLSNLCNAEYCKWEGDALPWYDILPFQYSGLWQYPSQMSQYLLGFCKHNPVMTPRGTAMCSLLWV